MSNVFLKPCPDRGLAARRATGPIRPQSLLMRRLRATRGLAIATRPAISRSMPQVDKVGTDAGDPPFTTACGSSGMLLLVTSVVGLGPDR